MTDVGSLVLAIFTCFFMVLPKCLVINLVFIGAKLRKYLLADIPSMIHIDTTPLFNITSAASPFGAWLLGWSS